MAAILRSRPIPATIGTLFGGLWAFLAATAAPPEWQTPAAVFASFTTVALIARLWVNRPPRSASDASLFGRKAYVTAVVAELIAIYAASILLPRLGGQGFLLQAVGIIVGLHFIGLWVATKSLRFVGITVGMCAVSAVAILLPQMMHAIHLRDFVTGAGNALVLWLGAGRADARKQA